ncbi:MAG: SMI1/KNR4 family protein [Bacteroidetes bacterium]|nr:SMI1/KNR4 family protein [Bacteroidota bacterium]
MKYFSEIDEILLKYAVFGKKELADGTLLIAPAKFVAPEAWVHQIYPPLNEDEIKILEEQIAGLIPNSYVIFLKEYSNGINIFNDVLALFGYRKRRGRGIDDVWQPYSMIIPNTIERIKNATDEMIFIGSYSWDGSKIYINRNTEKVYRCLRGDITPLNEWDCFEQMIVTEIKRLSKLHTNEGKRLDRSIPTIPS